MLVYDVKLPDRIEAYEIAPASIRRHDDIAFVCDLIMPSDIDGIGIRHYSFPDRWWAANVFVDMDGAPRTDVEFPYDCDITTPHFEAFGVLCNVDLKLDVFVKHDGVSYDVRDRDDFARCLADGSVDNFDRIGAEAGLSDLIALIERNDFVAYLDDICPRRPLDDAAEVVVLPLQRNANVAVLDAWRARRPTAG